jgi:hypothetical protein
VPAYSIFDARAWATLVRALDIYRSRGDGDGFARAVSGMPLVLNPLTEFQFLTYAEATRLAGNGGPEVNVNLRYRSFQLLQSAPAVLRNEELPRLEAELTDLLSRFEQIPERKALAAMLAGMTAFQGGQFGDGARELLAASHAYAEIGLMSEAISNLVLASFSAMSAGDVVQATEVPPGARGAESSAARRDRAGHGSTRQRVPRSASLGHRSVRGNDGRAGERGHSPLV